MSPERSVTYVSERSLSNIASLLSRDAPGALPPHYDCKSEYALVRRLHAFATHSAVQKFPASVLPLAGGRPLILSVRGAASDDRPYRNSHFFGIPTFDHV